MKYNNIIEGKFIKRINRFCATVDINGIAETVHVKTTGRCEELFVAGAKVFLEPSDNPNRKTKYSLIAVYKGDILVNVDSQSPNSVGAEGLAEGKLLEIGAVDFIRREMKYGDSRLDIHFMAGERKGFIEIKGVTLEEDGVARFPDAPTTRGRKHLLELAKAVEEGYECYVLFVIQMGNTRMFSPHWLKDRAFSETLAEVAGHGVGILAYDCTVLPDTLEIRNPIPIDLQQDSSLCSE